MTRYAFDLSEKIGTPVMIRVTTRLAHSRSGVECSEKREQNELHLPSNLRQFVLLPAIAKKQYKSLLSKQSDMEQESMTRGFNQYFDGADKSKGIITCGLAYNYLKGEAAHRGSVSKGKGGTGEEVRPGVQRHEQELSRKHDGGHHGVAELGPRTGGARLF